MKIPEVSKINGLQTYSPANKIQLDSGTRQYFQDDDDCTYIIVTTIDLFQDSYDCTYNLATITGIEFEQTT
jgi:hypothetical protein